VHLAITVSGEYHGSVQKQVFIGSLRGPADAHVACHDALTIRTIPINSKHHSVRSGNSVTEGEAEGIVA
jgi:hypothetical protein